MLETKYQSKTATFEAEDPMILEGGDTLQDHRIFFTTYGQLNHEKSNVVWIFHALTGTSDPLDWWEGLIGGGTCIDPEKHFIVCANMIGSCYGSAEPKDDQFPLVTISDMVRGFRKLKAHLGIDRIFLGLGGSMGGQVLLEWAVQEPELFETIVPIATNAVHSPWAIAFNEAQRMALRLDTEKGIEVARAIGMLSYRHYQTFAETQQDTDHRKENFSAASYQIYQGQKLKKRFSTHSYYALSRTMDSHNVGRHYSSLEEALGRIQSRVLSVGVDTDLLFPNDEQKLIARTVPNGTYHEITSLYGHDGFLVETHQINDILQRSL